MRVVDRGRKGQSRLWPAVKARLTFRRLRRIGLIPKLDAGGSRLFHEAIAELCIDRLSRDPTFERPFIMAGGTRLEEQLEDGMT